MSTVFIHEQNVQHQKKLLPYYVFSRRLHFTQDLQPNFSLKRHLQPDIILVLDAVQVKSGIFGCKLSPISHINKDEFCQAGIGIGSVNQMEECHNC